MDCHKLPFYTYSSIPEHVKNKGFIDSSQITCILYTQVKIDVIFHDVTICLSLYFYQSVLLFGRPRVIEKLYKNGQ